jgi:hypothetical protein
MLQRGKARAEDARFVQYLKRALTSRDMKLVSRPTLESATSVGPDLRGDTERAQEAEGAARDRGVGHVEVDGDLAATPEVNAACGVEEPRQLRQAIARAARRDRRELVPKVFRE